LPKEIEAEPQAAVGLPAFQAVLDQLDQGCAIFDTAQRLAAWNRQLLGHAFGTVVGLGGMLSDAQMRYGWTIGGGVEYQLTRL
jgi:opacity protein-like surface antigen